MKISELYGKSITQTNGKRRGTILGATYRENAIDRLICCDENEKRFCVAAENAAFSRNGASFSKAEAAKRDLPVLRLGKAVYDCGGNFCGYMQDVNLSGAKITSAIIAGKRVPFGKLIIGDVCLIRDDSQAETAAKDMFIEAVLSAAGNGEIAGSSD